MSDSHNQTPAEMEAAIEDLKRQIASATQAGMQRITCDPESIEQGLAKLVLGLIELLRQLLERQAVRRMEGGSLTDEQVENMGQSLMKLEEKILELAAQFGLKPEDLSLQLGPLTGPRNG
jgi:phage shock protein A